MPRIDVRAQAHASPQQVWTVLADTASWADWAPFDEVAVEQGHEVGEVRRLRSGRQSRQLACAADAALAACGWLHYGAIVQSSPSTLAVARSIGPSRYRARCRAHV